MTKIILCPPNRTVTIDGEAAPNVDFTGIDPTILNVVWSGSSGFVTYSGSEGEGFTPAPTPITSIEPYQTYIDEGAAIIEAANNPVTFFFTQTTDYLGSTYPLGSSYVSTEVGHPAPPNTTTTPPPSVPGGAQLYWYSDDWVVSSFDPSLNLPQAKSSLIQTVTVDGAAAVNGEIALYSTVQQIEAPSVAALDTKSYPGTSIGDYQDYVDFQVASATATINAATSTEDLYGFNPAEIPFTPSANGTIFTGRGSGLGPLDMNVSYYAEWNSTTILENDTELYVPGTDTVITYGSGGPNQFDSAGNCFTTGDYQVQIRQVSTGFVLAEYECPLSPSGENVEF